MLLVVEEAEKRSCDVRVVSRSFLFRSVLATIVHAGTLVAFKVYDMDRDGFISNGELFLVLKMMVGNNLKVRPPCHLANFGYRLTPSLLGPTITTNCR